MGGLAIGASAMNPLFSLAIATYNRETMLRQCIQSCLMQEFTDFEIVVVDGASTDGSVAMARQFSDSRVRLFVQSENLGISAGRYDAVIHSRGGWIVQVDSDHVLEVDALNVLKHAIDNLHDDRIGAVCARYRWDDGHVTPAFIPLGTINYEARMRWVEREGGRDCVFCARRSALLESNWFKDRKASMDALFHLNFSKRWRELFINHEIARQCANAGNSSTRGHVGRARSLRKWGPDMAWQYEEIVRVHGKALSIHGPSAFREALRQASLHNFYSGNRKLAVRYGLNYLREAPTDFCYWAVLVTGVFAPPLLGYLNQWRHAFRDKFGI